MVTCPRDLMPQLLICIHGDFLHEPTMKQSSGTVCAAALYATDAWSAIGSQQLTCRLHLTRTWLSVPRL